MKKILFFLLFSSFTFGQISPYYGEQEVYSYKYQFKQITYYDVASVETNLHLLLHDRLKLNEVNSKENFTPDLESGTIEKTYSTSVGSSVYRMKLKFNVALYDDQHLVKSLNISGDPYLVTKFYLYAWRTKIQEGDLKKNELVKNYYMQDDISYQFHNGKPVISITNRELKSIADFKAYREKSKGEVLEKIENSEIAINVKPNFKTKSDSLLKKEIAENSEKLRLERAASSKSEVYFIDSNSGKIKPTPNEQVLSFITKSLDGAKKGTYSFFIKDINAPVINGNYRLIK